MNERIYLDYNATAPLAPEVAAAMSPFLTNAQGNPSSSHWAGLPARDAVEAARSQVAALLCCDATEVVFTSGGTEANNHAIKGSYFAARDRGTFHLITSRVEHPAVLEPCGFLERLGAEVTRLPVDRFGRVDPDDVRRAIRSNTVLISVMHANNEVGTVQPVAEIGGIAREHGVLFHTDAAQTVGKIRVDVEELQVDLLSIAGHKLYAPKGIGALYVREGVELDSLLHGGDQEAGNRAGTESALLTTALGAACALSQDWIDRDLIHKLRDRFWELLQDRFQDRVVLNGHPTLRLPNTLNVSFLGWDGATLLARLEGVAASTGSACHAGQAKASPVLTAMQADSRIAAGAIRFSLGRKTSLEEIEEVVERLVRLVGGGGGRTGVSTSDACYSESAAGKPLAEMTSQEIMAAVTDRYGQVAQRPHEKFNFPVGRAFAESVGYDPALLARLPAGISESFTGAGNPQPFTNAKPGETVLDLGCGAGLDLYHYAVAVGPTGKVYGLDLSEAMLDKAAENLQVLRIENTTLLQAPASQIPLPDASVDLVTANGIFNLSPDKDAVMREVARVLKPGGRTIFAEIVAKDELPGDIRRDLNDWFRCIGGALTKEKLFDSLRRAGLSDPQVLWSGRNARTGHPLSICAVIRAELSKG